MTSNKEEMRAALKPYVRQRLAQESLLDFCRLMDPTYESVRHTNLLIEHLEALERRDIEKLATFMPPRHSKTYHVSERFPGWFLGRHPSSQVILASYGSDLAETNSRKVRGLMLDERWPFKTRVASDASAVGRWLTTDGGSVLAAGVNSAASGFGATFLGVDDPIKDREAANSELQRERTWVWYTDVARTRLMPKAVQLLTQTRWHDDDLAGRLLNSSEANSWTVLTLPAIAKEEDILGRCSGEALWPSWYPIEKLLEQREIMGSRSFESLYQQSPLPDSGGMFRREWFSNRYSYLPTMIATIQAIDCAAKTGIANDYSAISTWGTDGVQFFLIDAWHGKLEFPGLAQRIITEYQKHRPNAVMIEEASNGIAIVSELRRATALPIVGVVPRGPKISRAEAVTAYFEAGKVVLPTSAPWLDDWINEHLRFSSAAHDDFVDTTSLALPRLIEALSWARRRANPTRNNSRR